MKNIKFDLPISKPLFRFSSHQNNSTPAPSGNTSWTVLTVTTTTCVMDMGGGYD